MSTESLNRTSDAIENPSQLADRNNIVELDGLKQKTNTFETSDQVRKVSKRVREKRKLGDASRVRSPTIDWICFCIRRKLPSKRSLRSAEHIYQIKVPSAWCRWSVNARSYGVGFIHWSD